MESYARLRTEISEAAEEQYRKLERAKLLIPAIIKPPPSATKLYSFYDFKLEFKFVGSLSNGTYTVHSDIDIVIKQGFISGSNFADHLRSQGIVVGSRSARSPIVPFHISSEGQTISVNALVVSYDRGAEGQEVLSKISRSVGYYADVVRFFKTFATIFVDRFPDNHRSPAVAPGSYFYNVSVALACGHVSGKYPYDVVFPLAYTYEEAIKLTCNFIGNNIYDAHSGAYIRFGAVVKFGSQAIKEHFNKLFRSLLAYVNSGRIPAGLSASPHLSDRSTVVNALFRNS